MANLNELPLAEAKMSIRNMLDAFEEINVNNLNNFIDEQNDPKILQTAINKLNKMLLKLSAYENFQGELTAEAMATLTAEKDQLYHVINVFRTTRLREIRAYIQHETDTNNLRVTADELQWMFDITSRTFFSEFGGGI